jgi:tRNA1(Val) A37 N6-methylase TrmN6
MSATTAEAPPGFAPGALTRDGFLDGRVRIWQPRDGFRSGIDAVFLAAAVPARPGDRVLELGIGAGAASLCLAARVPGLRLTGVELQPAYAALARANAEAAGIALEVVAADLAALPAGLRRQTFEQVLMNPPYFPLHGRTPSPDAGREAARGRARPLADWVAAAARRLAAGGTLTLIIRAEALPEALAACAGRVGSLAAKPLAPHAGRPARLVLLRGRKGGRGAFRLCAPLVLHRGDRHAGAGDSYTPEARAILRDGAALSF